MIPTTPELPAIPRAPVKEAPAPSPSTASAPVPITSMPISSGLATSLSPLGEGDLGTFQFATYSLFYAVLDRTDKANQYYAGLVQESEQKLVRPAFLARANVAIGDYERALENLHAIADEIENGWVSGGMMSLVHNHYKDPMLDTPEFAVARERILAALHYE